MNDTPLCCLFCHGIAKTHLKQIETTKNKIVRNIATAAGCDNMRTSQIFKKFGILKLNDLYHQK